MEVNVADLTFQKLGVLTNSEGSVLAQQLLLSETLIFIFTLSTPENYKTDNPEVDWEKQLDIVITAKDLKYVLGMSTVLQAVTPIFEDVLMRVRMKIPFAQKQTVHYCTLDFGHVWQFGEDNNFLMVIETPEVHGKEDIINKFMENNFPYIQALGLKIGDFYQHYLKLREHLKDIESQIIQFENDLLRINQETDPIMLAIRKDHLGELGNEALRIQSGLKRFADQIDLSLIKLQTAIKRFSTIKDEIFLECLRKYNNYNHKVQNLLKKDIESSNKITEGIFKYSSLIEKLINKLEKGMKEPILEPKTYTSFRANGESFSIDGSPYRSKEEELRANLSFETEVLDSIPLEWCSSYILSEKKPSRSLKIFSELVSDKFIGMCITTEDINRIIKKYDLKDTSIYNISNEPGENRIPPVLSKISHLIHEFLSNNYHSIVYLDGLDFLIKYNDFNRVLKFCNNIKETVVLNDAIFIMSLNEQSMDKNNLAFIMENSIDITRSEVLLEDLM